jgi:hypothetical protein
MFLSILRAPSPPPLRAFRQPISSAAQPPRNPGFRPGIVGLEERGFGPIAGSGSVINNGLAGLRGTTLVELGGNTGGTFDIHISLLAPPRRYYSVFFSISHFLIRTSSLFLDPFLLFFVRFTNSIANFESMCIVLLSREGGSDIASSSGLDTHNLDPLTNRLEAEAANPNLNPSIETFGATQRNESNGNIVNLAVANSNSNDSRHSNVLEENIVAPSAFPLPNTASIEEIEVNPLPVTPRPVTSAAFSSWLDARREEREMEREIDRLRDQLRNREQEYEEAMRSMLFHEAEATAIATTLASNIANNEAGHTARSDTVGNFVDVTTSQAVPTALTAASSNHNIPVEILVDRGEDGELSSIATPPTVAGSDDESDSVSVDTEIATETTAAIGSRDGDEDRLTVENSSDGVREDSESIEGYTQMSTSISSDGDRNFRVEASSPTFYQTSLDSLTYDNEISSKSDSSNDSSLPAYINTTTRGTQKLFPSFQSSEPSHSYFPDAHGKVKEIESSSSSSISGEAIDAYISHEDGGGRSEELIIERDCGRGTTASITQSINKKDRNSSFYGCDDITGGDHIGPSLLHESAINSYRGEIAFSSSLSFSTSSSSGVEKKEEGEVDCRMDISRVTGIRISSDSADAHIEALIVDDQKAIEQSALPTRDVDSNDAIDSLGICSNESSGSYSSNIGSLDQHRDKSRNGINSSSLLQRIRT